MITTEFAETPWVTECMASLSLHSIFRFALQRLLAILLGMYRLTIRYQVSHYPVLTGPGKIIYPSKFHFFQSEILNRIVDKKHFVRN